MSAGGRARWVPFHRETGLAILGVLIASLQELLSRAAEERRLTWIDLGSAGLTGLIALRLVFQQPPARSGEAGSGGQS